MRSSELPGAAGSRLTGSGRGLMIGVLALIAVLALLLLAIGIVTAGTAFRYLRAPVPTRLPRDLPVPARPPRPLNDVATWFGPDDYPAQAIRRNQEGRVRVALLIDADGRPSACEVMESSHHRLLDRATCRAAVRHARYAPARDRSGAAIPARVDLSAVRWRLPSE